MADEHDIFIDPDGTVRMIYSDATVALFAGEPCTVRRASHVEPVDGGLTWAADMSPVGGPTLGPFATRQAALDAEVAWLLAKLAAGTLDRQ